MTTRLLTGAHSEEAQNNPLSFSLEGMYSTCKSSILNHYMYT